MIKITDKTECSGCTACMSVCGKSAITMEPDALGFLYPKVDMDKCVECGLCEKVCEFQDRLNSRDKQELLSPRAYLARHYNPEEVLKSKSGAAFVFLSDVILKEGGSVYGAKLNSEHLVEHGRALSAEERDQFRGSKYIQSDIRGIFSQVKQDLLAGKKVMFSGTPCQIDGLKGYLRGRYTENLYLVDILCHGVGAPKIWQEHLIRIETRKRKKIKRCIPRNPKYGWYNNVDTFIFEDGSQYNSEYFTGYIYHKWITQRWSCNVCPFTTLNRISDVTIGDAWGIGRVAPEFDPKDQGSSIILLNTKKGEELFESVQDVIKKEVDIKDMMQPVLRHPTTLHKNRGAFEKLYLKRGYKISKFIFLNNTLVSAKSKIWRILRRVKHVLVK